MKFIEKKKKRDIDHTLKKIEFYRDEEQIFFYGNWDTFSLSVSHVAYSLE